MAKLGSNERALCPSQSYPGGDCSLPGCIISSGSRGSYELRAQNLEAGIKELLAGATATAS